MSDKPIRPNAPQLFVYYRVEKAHLPHALLASKLMAAELAQAGVATAKLYVRQEDNKPYHTLMEVFSAGPQAPSEVLAWQQQIEATALVHFSEITPVPVRTVEVFAPLGS